MLKYVLLWFPMAAVAVANGVLRQTTYGPRMGELRAHQLSTITGIVLIGLFMWAVLRVWPPRSSRQAAAIGLVWAAMTLAFEFLFMHYVAGHSWQRLLAEYDLPAGRVWVFVPLWVAAAPYLFFRASAR